MAEETVGCRGCDIKRDRIADEISDVSSGTPAVNDNENPTRNAVTIADLAVAMQVDEETVLQRIAKILSERQTGSPDIDEE